MIEEITFHQKVVDLQTQLKAPKGQRNNFGNYNYRNCEDILEAIKPHLKDSGLVLNVTDEVTLIGDRFYVKSKAMLIDGQGHSYESLGFARESEIKKGMDAAQITGAASSYARKYALNGLLCIDDTKDADSNDNSKSEVKTEKSQGQRKVIMPSEKQVKYLINLLNQKYDKAVPADILVAVAKLDTVACSKKIEGLMKDLGIEKKK